MFVSRSPTRKGAANTRSSCSGSQSGTPDEPSASGGKALTLPQSQAPTTSHDRSETAEPHGAVASAIQALPIDAGTLVSPTISRPPGNSGSACKGGPGNPSCNLEVKEHQEGVQCDICMVWYHRLCQDILKSAFNALMRFDAASFICSFCKQMPSLDKLLPRAPQKDAATQVGQDDQAIQTVMKNSSTQTNPTASTADNDTDPRMLSELVLKVDRLEKALMEHITVLTRNTQLTTNQTMTHHDNMNLEQADNRKQTYAETLVKGGAQSMAQCSSSRAAFLAPTKQVQASQQHHHQSQDYRMMVREELLELDERKKRRASLVIRGLRASSTTEAVTRFAEVTEFLIGEKVVLSETVRIKSNVDLFRGNVNNYRQRKLILEQSRGLKDSPFAEVYIKRDLTYHQRMQLQARYQKNHPETRDRSVKSTGAAAHENTRSEAEPIPPVTRALRPHHSPERLPNQSPITKARSTSCPINCPS